MRAADDLIAFLNARLDEDEHYLRTMIDVGERGAAAAPPEDLADVAAMAIGFLSVPEVREMVGRWADSAVPVPNDLRRLLREVEAKRRILAEVVPEIGGMDMQIIGEWGDRADQPDAHLPLLRIMAGVYSDHPDYRQEWKP